MWTLTFWRAVAERAISTAAETAIALIGATVVFGAVNWRMIGSAVLLAALLSVLKGIASAKLTDGLPSLTGAEVLSTTPVFTAWLRRRR
jgi:Putative lactococcus lactis phage r1t holin